MNSSRTRKNNLPPMPTFKPPPLPKEEIEKLEIDLSSYKTKVENLIAPKALLHKKVSSSHSQHQQSSIAQFLKWCPNLYLALDDAVRSTRLEELRDRKVINLYAEDQRKNSCLVQKESKDNVTKIFINPHVCHPRSLLNLTDLLKEQIESDVCLVKAKDFNLTGLLTLAFAINHQKMSFNEAIGLLRSKRGDLKLDFQVRKLLLEFELHLKEEVNRRNKNKNGKMRLPKFVQKLARLLFENWFPVSVFAILLFSIVKLVLKSRE